MIQALMTTTIGRAVLREMGCRTFIRGKDYAVVWGRGIQRLNTDWEEEV